MHFPFDSLAVKVGWFTYMLFSTPRPWLHTDSECTRFQRGGERKKNGIEKMHQLIHKWSGFVFMMQNTSGKFTYHFKVAVVNDENTTRVCTAWTPAKGREKLFWTLALAFLFMVFYQAHSVGNMTGFCIMGALYLMTCLLTPSPLSEPSLAFLKFQSYRYFFGRLWCKCAAYTNMLWFNCRPAFRFTKHIHQRIW